MAGLWLLNRLQGAGYNAILLEQRALGSGQSIASQGMIHGGVKYTLAGTLSGASEAIADMPDYWRACLAGRGPVDLTGTRTLSDHFYMWSTENTLSKITGFLASKTLRGRVQSLEPQAFPPVFHHPAFKGRLYQLVDSVMDTTSLLGNLANNMAGRVFRLDAVPLRWQREQNRMVLSVSLAGHDTVIEAGQFILAAGKGNETLLGAIGATQPEMQTRPLQQVMVKHHNDYALYAHCVGADSTPRLTISSHRCQDGMMCWYLGGQLAEQGVGKTAAVLIREAKNELLALFPWLDWQQAQWATYVVDRAEPRQKNRGRPDRAFMDRATLPSNLQDPLPGGDTPCDNVLVAWPTKLTLAPHLGDEVLQWMKRSGIPAGQCHTDPALIHLPVPAVAQAPWDLAEWQS